MSRGEKGALATKTQRHRFTPASWTGAAIVAGFVIVAVTGPWLARYRPIAIAGAPLQPPGWRHWLGTNSAGQDLVSQWLAGARTSLSIAALGGGATMLLATAAGSLAGWWGGMFDAVIMRLVDIVLVIPTVPLIIVIGAYTRPTALSLSTLIALTSWPVSARLIRVEVLSLRGRAHLRAAVGFGASTGHVLIRHVMPDSALILIATAIRAAERAIAVEVGLAFLGLTMSPNGSWGTMVSDALHFHGLFFTRAWLWWLLPPIVAVSLFLTGLALMGSALDEPFNPRLARPGTASAR